MKEALFRGTCTAVVTPFAPEGLDLERLKRQLETQWRQGVGAVVLAGTTGESAALSPREFESLTAAAVAHVGGRMKCIVGVGGNNTAACLDRAMFAAAAGADAVLMTPPYYNKTSPAGLLAHFTYVADRCPIPLILYNVPSRTAIGITPEAYQALAEYPNINGVKEASGDMALASRLASELGDSLRLYCGNDDLTLPMMALGADGVISVASNVVPAELVRLTGLCLSGDYGAARAQHKKLSPLFRLLFTETNPIPVKAAMALLGTDSGRLRLPLVELGEERKAALRTCLERLRVLE